MSVVTPTRTSRPSGSRTTSRSSRSSTTTNCAASAMAVSGLRRMGEGNPPLHRFRMGLEFVISGHREVDGMIEHHAAVARMLGAQLELPEAVLDALGAAYEKWDGKGWPGELEGDADPAGGPAGAAGRVRRGRPPSRRGGGRDRAGAQAQRQAVRPGWRRVPVRGPRGDPRRPGRRRHLGRRDRRRARPRRRALGRAVRRGPDRDRELRRSQVALHARACARRGRPRRRAAGTTSASSEGERAHAAPRRARPRLRAAGDLERDLGQAGAARGRASGSACACSRT